MGIVALSEDVLVALAKQINQECEEFKVAYGRLTELVGAVDSGAFNGQIADAFKAAYDKNKSTFEEVQKDVELIHQQLTRNITAAVDLMQEAEEKIKSSNYNI